MLQLTGLAGLTMSLLLGRYRNHVSKSYSSHQFNKYRMITSFLIGLSSFYLFGYNSVVILKCNSKIGNFEALRTLLVNNPSMGMNEKEQQSFIENLRAIENMK